MLLLSLCACTINIVPSESTSAGAPQATNTTAVASGPPANIAGKWYGTTSYSGGGNLPANYDIWMDITQASGSTAVTGRFEICWQNSDGPIMRAWLMDGTVTSTSVTFNLQQGTDITRAAGQVKPNEMDLTLTDAQTNAVGITTMAPGIAPFGFGVCS